MLIQSVHKKCKLINHEILIDQIIVIACFVNSYIYAWSMLRGGGDDWVGGLVEPESNIILF